MLNSDSTDIKPGAEFQDGVQPLPSESSRQIIIDILATAIVDILLVEKSVDQSAHGSPTS